MVFSSLEFVFFILPIALLCDWVCHRSLVLRNVCLLAVSLLFYGWSNPKLILLLMAIIMINWGAAYLVDVTGKRWIGVTAVVVDIADLFFFKYFSWMLEGASDLFGLSINIRKISLPIGISFFTFQAISYVIDVMRGKAEVQKNPLKVGLYISFFPQLIAGPIVRYTDIEKQINDRSITLCSFGNGIERFMIGFSKKVLLADNMGIIADKSWLALRDGNLGCSFAWLGALAYTFQIFFDFSGYSDMAIGLAKMFGFDIPENFNMPYLAKSFRDFWRRWHISLSTWFRDYVYIPLGGNRVSSGRLYRNLAIVWMLTGLWHGANLTFLVWGGIYGLLIIMERRFRIDQYLEGKRIRQVFYGVFTFAVVVLLWVIFRSDNIAEAFRYIGVMMSPSTRHKGGNYARMYLFEMKYEILGCMLLSWLAVPQRVKDNVIYMSIKPIVAFALFLVSICYLVKGSYSPFLYFDF